MATRIAKIDEVAQDMDRITETIQSLLLEVQASKQDFNKTQQDLTEITENIHALSECLKSGQDLYALTARVIILESALAEMKKITLDVESLVYDHVPKIQLINAQLTEVAKKVETLIINDRDGKVKIWVAVIGGVCTVIASIILLVMNLMK